MVVFFYFNYFISRKKSIKKIYSYKINLLRKEFYYDFFTNFVLS